MSTVTTQRDITQGTAERLSGLLHDRETTAQTLSFDMRVSPSVVSRWVSGQTAPSARYIVELCAYFNVSADWLLGLSPDPHPTSRAAGTSSDDRRGDAGDADAPPPPDTTDE